ncbi:MAG TPA: hypothetical protein PLQ36_00935 [Candidatus Gracilibacteria bacterium]|nr:hypothetical protein [Candidatus Gracilibacteria bacterium]
MVTPYSPEQHFNEQVVDKTAHDSNFQETAFNKLQALINSENQDSKNFDAKGKLDVALKNMDKKEKIKKFIENSIKNTSGVIDLKNYDTEGGKKNLIDYTEFQRYYEDIRKMIPLILTGDFDLLSKTFPQNLDAIRKSTLALSKYQDLTKSYKLMPVYEDLKNMLINKKISPTELLNRVNHVEAIVETYHLSDGKTLNPAQTAQIKSILNGRNDSAIDKNTARYSIERYLKHPDHDFADILSQKYEGGWREINTTLYNKMNNAQVSQGDSKEVKDWATDLQRYLNTKGLNLELDGKIGPLTLAAFSKILQKDFKQSLSHQVKKTAEKVKNPDESERLMIEAIKLNPSLENHQALTDLYLKEGKTSKAINLYLKMLELDTSSADRIKIWPQLGEAYMKTGDYVNAIKFFDKYIDANKRNMNLLTKEESATFSKVSKRREEADGLQKRVSAKPIVKTTE